MELFPKDAKYSMRSRENSFSKFCGLKDKPTLHLLTPVNEDAKLKPVRRKVSSD
jgi:hypothetical protein